MVQIATYGRETSKKALRSIASGLEVPEETISYITSLIPSERGMQLSLSQTYYGDEDHTPVAAFVEQMNEMPELWEHAQKIENLVTQLGVHAGGVIFSNNRIEDNNSIMKTKNGVLITAYDLHESEDTGLIKYDLLSVDGIGKLKVATYLLLQHKKIEWKGSLESTFKFHFSPAKLKPNQQTWDNISAGAVDSLFQLSTPVGQSAIKLLNIKSVEEMGMINSLMRLQPQSQGEMPPLNVFAEHRKDINLWYEEMARYGLNQDEVKTMEDHLLHLNGVSDTQESIMLMSMDSRIAGFTVAEANFLRKSVARKNPKVQEEVRQLFYARGQEHGVRQEILDYVWGVQVRYQLGYSFSLPHVAAYSYIALQEACIYTDFPSIFWNTACLIDDAGAFTEEDFPELIESGYLKASEKYLEINNAEDLGDVKIEATPIDRDKIAGSIAKFQETTHIEKPNINTSGFGFTLIEATGSIQTGLKIISSLGNKFIYEILRARPFDSFQDFLSKTNIPKNRIVMLIKSGAFRDITSQSTLELLEDYVLGVSNPKSVLNGRNIQMLIRMELLPDSLGESIRAFNWWKYVSPTKKVKPGYIQLDENALRFYEEKYDVSKLEYYQEGTFVSDTYAKREVDKSNEAIKEYIKANHSELVRSVNKQLFKDEWQKYKSDTEADAEMQSLRMYTAEHPLSRFNLSYDKVSEMEESNFVGQFNIKGKVYPKWHIYRTVGTVIAKDKLKNMVTILTPEGPIKLKLWKDIYTIYDKTATVVENGQQLMAQDSFFTVGTHLLVLGKFEGGMLYPKVYRGTGVKDVIYKININGDTIETEGKLDESATD